LDRHKIIQRETLYVGFNRLTELTYQYRRLNGEWSENVTREIFERRAAAAVLPYDPLNDSVVLVRQFRPGALMAGSSGWELEPVAGLCDNGELPMNTVRREAMEEAGCQIDKLEKICSYNVSPGCVREPVSVFCGCVDSRSVLTVGGTASEHEETEVFVMPFDEFQSDLLCGKFTYALTIIAAQWLILNRDRLREKWATNHSDT
jgi:ADP-ribose pyrophosphatase